jgi:mRNA-degrading endonuclease YafQ of YafQ-DinJ toxin-antitoxin module
LRAWLKAHPDTLRDIESALETLSNDDIAPSLKVHKLRGPLSGCWACSAGYDVRIVFDYLDDQGRQAIRLLTLGTHDEVY